MKISMFMLLAGAAIVFASPAANARQIITEHSFIPHKVVKHVKTTTKTATGATKTAPRPPLYIYVPAFTGTSTPAVSDGTDSCESYMVDCSDQQLCDHWGLNCATAGIGTSSPALATDPQTLQNG